jgi:transcriptional regulator with XRE-family HTH domain
MFSENLKKYRKQSGYTQEQLATAVNNLLDSEYTKSNIQSWERGVNPKIEVISAIAEILNIPEQFLFDDSSDAVDKIVSREVPNLKNIVDHVKEIPLLKGYVGAGSSGVIDEVEIEKYLYIDTCLVKKAYQNKEIKALTIVGDSMIPYVDNNDIVLYHPIKKGQYNLIDGKYIIETINGIMLKNLKFCCNGDIVISSCNKAYRDEIIRATESQEYLDIIGIAVGRLLKD